MLGCGPFSAPYSGLVTTVIHIRFFSRSTGSLSRCLAAGLRTRLFFSLRIAFVNFSPVLRRSVFLLLFGDVLITFLFPGLPCFLVYCISLTVGRASASCLFFFLVFYFFSWFFVWWLCRFFPPWKKPLPHLTVSVFSPVFATIFLFPLFCDDFLLPWRHHSSVTSSNCVSASVVSPT